MKNDLPILKTYQLSKDYVRGNEIVHALQNCTLHIQRGEFIAIMGASGSGKSTLLNILGGLESATSGEYVFLGTDVTRYPEKKWVCLRRDYFGYIFQAFYLISTLTVQENIELPLLFTRKNVDSEYILDIAKKVGIQDRLNHLPSQLSGGEMQRTAIARALVQKPSILIVDEPTGNLDSHNANTIFQIFAQLNEKENITVLCATHDLEMAKKTHRILHMQDGVIRE